MGYLNKVMLIGRIGQAPEKRTTQNGNSVVTVSLATNDYYTDASGQRQEKTEWHRVVFWNKLADVLCQYTRKGSQIYAEGTLRTREWNDRDGNKRYTTEVTANVLQFLDSSGQNQGGPYEEASLSRQPPHPAHHEPATGAPSASPPQPGKITNDFVEDDIPF